MKLDPDRRFKALFKVICNPAASSVWSLMGCFLSFVLSSLLHPIRMRGYLENNKVVVHVDEKVRVRVEIVSLIEKLILAGYSLMALLIPVNLGERAYSTNFLSNFMQDLPFYGYALLFLAPCVLGSVFIAYRVNSVVKNSKEADPEVPFEVRFQEIIRSYIPFMLWFLAFGAVLVLMDGVATWEGMAEYRTDIFEAVNPHWEFPQLVTDFSHIFIRGFAENLTRIFLVPFTIISYGFSVSVFNLKAG